MIKTDFIITAPRPGTWCGYFYSKSSESRLDTVHLDFSKTPLKVEITEENTDKLRYFPFFFVTLRLIIMGLVYTIADKTGNKTIRNERKEDIVHHPRDFPLCT